MVVLLGFAGLLLAPFESLGGDLIRFNMMGRVGIRYRWRRLVFNNFLRMGRIRFAAITESVPKSFLVDGGLSILGIKPEVPLSHHS